MTGVNDPVHPWGEKKKKKEKKLYNTEEEPWLACAVHLSLQYPV